MKTTNALIAALGLAFAGIASAQEFPTDPAEHAKWDQSRVVPYSRTCTLLAPYERWDPDGTYRGGDPNSCTSVYECSKGHTWSRVER